MTTARAIGCLGLALLAVVVAGGVADRLGTTPHARYAAWAAGLVFAAAIVASLLGGLVGRAGPEAVVPAYWLAVGLRSILGLAGAALVAQLVIAPADRQAYWLWVLAAYLTALVVETVRQVREADRADAKVRGTVNSGESE